MQTSTGVKMNELKQILEMVFKDVDLPDDISQLKMGDIDGWDSLGNFNLIMEVEKTFQVEFDMDDLENITSIEDIVEKLNNDLLANRN